MREHKPIEVAIVGGGCAAVTTAFELTRPEHQGRYHVSVYQLGWRLGGKGASGRGPVDRIEEHGLHVWMGFYENAFRLLRECYAELGRDPDTCRIADWQQAFLPDPIIGVVDRMGSGVGRNWMAHFPPAPGMPGGPFTDRTPFGMGSYLVRTASLLQTLLRSCRVHQSEASGSMDPGAGPDPAGRPGPPSVEAVGETIARLMKLGVLATMTGLVEAVRLLEAMLASLSRYPESLPLRLLEEITSSARRQLAIIAEQDDETRRLWEIIDIMLAVLRGSIRFGLATDPRGLDAIDDYEWREWLRLNGASEASLDSAFLRGIYALMFGYENGDVNRPRMAAGQALRGAFRMFFTYRGAFFWKMQAGMGDVVFAPFYEVLKRRGVTFQFFHRLENVRLADPPRLGPGERAYVEALEFDVQAEIEAGREYEPLIDVGGLPCWPSTPDYRQLVDGERLEREDTRFESFWDRRRVGQKTLRVIDDFDFVVLGASIGAIPHVCSEIVERDPRWRAMVENVATVSTQAFQVWLREDLKQLGWNDPSVSISAFVPPFETWADMPQLLSEEGWRVRPGAIAYFCGVLPDVGETPKASDTGYPARRREEVRKAAVEFLERDVHHFWPNALRSTEGFRWELLIDPEESDPGRVPGAADESRFLSQFWTANVNPSDRYVLSLPGTQRYRISPLDNTYDNMTITGDWTECGHNAGCVEAAVISGRLAAHAISHLPKLEDIVGYDHP